MRAATRGPGIVGSHGPQHYPTCCTSSSRLQAGSGKPRKEVPLYSVAVPTHSPLLSLRFTPRKALCVQVNQRGPGHIHSSASVSTIQTQRTCCVYRVLRRQRHPCYHRPPWLGVSNDGRRRCFHVNVRCFWHATDTYYLTLLSLRPVGQASEAEMKRISWSEST